MAYLLCIAAAAAKPTVLYRYFHLWNLTRDCIQLFFSLFYAGNCCQKPSGVRVAWIFEQFCTFSFFYYCTAIHYQHTVTDSGHYSHIMGYQYDCYSQLIPQLLQQGKDLGLDRHIQRRCRFVCDQYLRVTCQCNGDHNSLLHTSGQFVRILLDPHLLSLIHI